MVRYACCDYTLQMIVRCAVILVHSVLYTFGPNDPLPSFFFDKFASSSAWSSASICAPREGSWPWCDAGASGSVTVFASA